MCKFNTYIGVVYIYECYIPILVLYTYIGVVYTYWCYIHILVLYLVLYTHIGVV